MNPTISRAVKTLLDDRNSEISRVIKKFSEALYILEWSLL
jgi:hypothetical protein